MFFCLRHPTVIGRNDEKREICRSHARDHVFDEILMAGHIDQAEMENLWLVLNGCLQVEMSEPEINCNPTCFLLRQTVWINPRQRFHQRALAVVHVTSGGENEMDIVHAKIALIACPNSSSCRGKTVRKSSLKREPAMYPTTGQLAWRSRAANSGSEIFRG